LECVSAGSSKPVTHIPSLKKDPSGEYSSASKDPSGEYYAASISEDGFWIELSKSNRSAADSRVTIESNDHNLHGSSSSSGLHQISLDSSNVELEFDVLVLNSSSTVLVKSYNSMESSGEIVSVELELRELSMGSSSSNHPKRYESIEIHESEEEKSAVEDDSKHFDEARHTYRPYRCGTNSGYDANSSRCDEIRKNESKESPERASPDVSKAIKEVARELLRDVNNDDSFPMRSATSKELIRRTLEQNVLMEAKSWKKDPSTPKVSESPLVDVDLAALYLSPENTVASPHGFEPASGIWDDYHDDHDGDFNWPSDISESTTEIGTEGTGSTTLSSSLGSAMQEQSGDEVSTLYSAKPRFIAVAPPGVKITPSTFDATNDWEFHFEEETESKKESKPCLSLASLFCSFSQFDSLSEVVWTKWMESPSAKPHREVPTEERLLEVKQYG
jgi:hypothetical protein